MQHKVGTYLKCVPNIPQIKTQFLESMKKINTLTFRLTHNFLLNVFQNHTSKVSVILEFFPFSVRNKVP